MSKWNKNRFTDHMMENCSREVAKVGNAIIDFSEKHADELSWGRGLFAAILILVYCHCFT